MTKKTEILPIELPFNSQEFADAWHEWLTYRSERKLPKYVPTGLKKTFSHLQNIAANDQQAIEIINQSIALNYQGLFPLKNNDGNTKGNSSIGKSIIFDRS